MEVHGIVVTIENDIEIKKAGGGVYNGSRLTYRDSAGALKEKCFHSNVFKFNPGIKASLSNLTPGESFVMVMEKEGEFWNTKSLSKEVPKTATSVASPTPAKTNGGSTYATAEERAKTQVYIVKQSSLTAALKYHEAIGNKKFTEQDAMRLAQEFTDWVMDTEPKAAVFSGSGFNDMTSDIPNWRYEI